MNNVIPTLLVFAVFNEVSMQKHFPIKHKIGVGNWYVQVIVNGYFLYPV